MKIIGKTDRGFIVEADKDEIYNLIGFYYSGSDGAPKLEVGHRIQIATMYQQLRKLAENESKIKTVRTALTSVADSLGLVDPVLRAVGKEEA